MSDRLEYLRGQLRAQTISYSELAELQSLAGDITPGDTELLEPAGVPEFPEHYSSDGYPIKVGAKFWDNNLRVVQITKVADWDERYSDTGEKQTWHDTTGGHADTLSGALREYGRLTRWFPMNRPYRERKDAEAYAAGTDYNSVK